MCTKKEVLEALRKERNRNKAGKRKRKWDSRRKQDRRQQEEAEEEEEEDDPKWGNWKDPDRDPEDKGRDWWQDHPGGPGGGPAMAAVCAIETELSQVSTLCYSPGGGKIEVNLDTGAAVTVIPLQYGDGTEVGSETKFRTASGAAIQDAGPCVLTGTLRNGPLGQNVAHPSNALCVDIHVSSHGHSRVQFFSGHTLYHPHASCSSSCWT